MDLTAISAALCALGVVCVGGVGLAIVLVLRFVGGGLGEVVGGFLNPSELNQPLQSSGPRKRRNIHHSVTAARPSATLDFDEAVRRHREQGSDVSIQSQAASWPSLDRRPRPGPSLRRVSSDRRDSVAGSLRSRSRRARDEKFDIYDDGEFYDGLF